MKVCGIDKDSRVKVLRWMVDCILCVLFFVSPECKESGEDPVPIFKRGEFN